MHCTDGGAVRPYDVRLWHKADNAELLASQEMERSKMTEAFSGSYPIEFVVGKLSACISRAPPWCRRPSVCSN